MKRVLLSMTPASSKDRAPHPGRDGFPDRRSRGRRAGACRLRARDARGGPARLEHARDGRLRLPRSSAPHAWRRQPKVVFCTTENGIDHIERALHAGANEYIMKPFDKDIVAAKFQEVGLIELTNRARLNLFCLP